MAQDLTYVYQKERKDFGKQCLFADKKYLMVSIPSNYNGVNVISATRRMLQRTIDILKA